MSGRGVQDEPFQNALVCGLVWAEGNQDPADPGKLLLLS